MGHYSRCCTCREWLVDAWLGEQLSTAEDVRWAESSPRRPRIHHNGPLKDDAHPFVVASGRVVELLDMALDEANIDSIVETALENDISAMTIRCGVDAELQPLSLIHISEPRDRG